MVMAKAKKQISSENPCNLVVTFRNGYKFYKKQKVKIKGGEKRWEP